MSQHVAIELADGTVLSGELVTVALAFLMHEYAPVAFGTPPSLDDLIASMGEQAPDEQSVDDLAPELRDPASFAHLVK